MDRETLSYLILVILIAVAGITIGLVVTWLNSGGAHMETHPVSTWIIGRLLA